MPIGTGIWFPGSLPASTSGTSARPAQSAVTSSGESRSSDRARRLGERGALDRLQVLVLRDHHDAVARRDAEQRDEADQRSDAEHAAAQHRGDDAAGGREGWVGSP
jgi:hypothetical protein